jgi:hypothetical protein
MTRKVTLAAVSLIASFDIGVATFSISEIANALAQLSKHVVEAASPFDPPAAVEWPVAASLRMEMTIP